jgi:tripartite ATP-independent transporter DctP family solute receptor
MIEQRTNAALGKFNASISAAVEAVRHTSEAIAATAQEQTTLMVALSESAGILAKQSQETSDRLTGAQTQARGAAEDLGNSFEVVETLLTSVQQLAELSAATAAAMDDFGRLMSEIGRMTEFVEDVSDETQLLALNAAIEAARAGTHGLGFAVVAGEVGRLAKTTSESTSTIKRLVSDVQREAEATIAAVRANAERSAESAPLADAARLSLGEIAELAADLSVAIDRAVVAGRDHSKSASEMRHQTDALATTAAQQGRQALESAFATQRLSYYGAEIAYIARTRGTAPGAAEHTTLKVATLLPPGYPPSRAWEHVARRAAELSQGRLRLELEIPFTGGTEFEALLRVRSGELDMVSVTTFVAGALLPLAQLFDLPFAFGNLEEAHAILDGPLGKHVLSSFESFGVTGMAYFENGMRHFTNSLRPIERPLDVKRMRVRIQDSVVYLALMHALGATPKVIPFNQLRAALAAREVDAQENPLPNILGARIHEVQKYLSLTAHAYNTQIVLANLDRMHRLGEEDREILRTAFAEATGAHRRIAAEDELRAVAELRKYLQIHELMPAEREAFVSASRFVWERMEPLFPADVYRLLVNRNLAAWHSRNGYAGESGHRGFTIDDIVQSIDASVRAVRDTGEGIAAQARSQIAGLQMLAQRAIRLSESNGTLAADFSALQERFNSVAPQVETMRTTVAQLIRTIETLSTMALQSRKALDQFAASMKQIVEIIVLVRSVADKTNLLALNAAIEAARAGEHGKGFNVVAGEVRNLAEKAKASTKEIRLVLSDLEARGKEAGVAIASGVQRAEHSARQAHAAQDAFGRIETFAFSASRALGDAHEAAQLESQRSHAMSGDYSQMAALVEAYAKDSSQALGVTVELEHQRKALFA